MAAGKSAPATVQFATFELNTEAGELRKYGIRIKLQDQPVRVLAVLVERAGELVSKEELRQRLWPSDTFVDFDHGLHSAITRLREALGDSSASPRYIETVPRRGYRFIAPVRLIGNDAHSEPPSKQNAFLSTSSRILKPGASIPAGLVVGGGAVLVFAVVITAWLRLRPEETFTQLTPIPLTAAQGWESGGTFSPDGNQIAYAWNDTGNGGKSHIYVKMIGSGRPVRLTTSQNSDYVPTWSPDGRSIAFVRELGQASALYLIPPLGGTERKLADGHFGGSMSWSPDSKFLAIADVSSPSDNRSLVYLISTENGQKKRLTTPANQKTWDQDPAFAPNGRKLLFTRCDGPFYCGLYLLDLTLGYHPSREPLLLRRETRSIGGSAWTRDGKEVVYAVSDDGGLNHHLMRIRLGGENPSQRLAYAG